MSRACGSLITLFNEANKGTGVLYDPHKGELQCGSVIGNYTDWATVVPEQDYHRMDSDESAYVLTIDEKRYRPRVGCTL